MHSLKSFITLALTVFLFSRSAQALHGVVLAAKPSNNNDQGVQDQDGDEDRPFFDNRKDRKRPALNRPAPAKVILRKSSYQGSGCPEGTMSVVMSSDNRAVSIVFDNFTTEAGQKATKQTTEKNCRVVIPIEAPQGFRMGVAQFDYRGFNALPAKSRAKLVAIHRIRHQINNAVGARVKSRQIFEGPIAEDFFMSAVIETKSPIKKNAKPNMPWINSIAKTCGGVFNLEIDVSIAVMSNPTGEQAMIALDSIDGQINGKKESIAYHLQWEPCK